jgi:hypothetical protein
MKLLLAFMAIVLVLVVGTIEQLIQAWTGMNRGQYLEDLRNRLWGATHPRPHLKRDTHGAIQDEMGASSSRQADLFDDALRELQSYNITITMDMVNGGLPGTMSATPYAEQLLEGLRRLKDLNERLAKYGDDYSFFDPPNKSLEEVRKKIKDAEVILELNGRVEKRLMGDFKVLEEKYNVNTSVYGTPDDFYGRLWRNAFHIAGHVEKLKKLDLARERLERHKVSVEGLSSHGLSRMQAEERYREACERMSSSPALLEELERDAREAVKKIRKYGWGPGYNLYRRMDELDPATTDASLLDDIFHDATEYLGIYEAEASKRTEDVEASDTQERSTQHAE